MKRIIDLAICAVTLIAAAPIAAEDMTTAPADCSASPPLPAELAGWKSPQSLSAAAFTGRIRSAELTPGKAAKVALLATPDVHYPVQPEKPGGSASHGGLLGFTITKPGTYRVALGSAAWIDVIRAGKTIGSTAHGHGPACSGIRKMVDFPLAAGRYVLAISANGDAMLPVMVARLP